MAVVADHTNLADLLAEGLRAAGVDLDYFIFDPTPHNNPGAGSSGTGTSNNNPNVGTGTSSGSSGTGTSNNPPNAGTPTTQPQPGSNNNPGTTPGGNQGNGGNNNPPDVSHDFFDSNAQKIAFTLLVGIGIATDTFEANAQGVAMHPSDRFIFETDTGKLFFDADGSNSGASIEVVTITDHAWLTQFASLTGTDIFHI